MIDNKIYDLVNECEKDVKDQFDKIDILLSLSLIL